MEADGSRGAAPETDSQSLELENARLRQEVSRLTARLAGLQVSYDTLKDMHEAREAGTAEPQDEDMLDGEITNEALRKRLSRLCAPKANGLPGGILLPELGGFKYRICCVCSCSLGP